MWCVYFFLRKGGKKEGRKEANKKKHIHTMSAPREKRNTSSWYTSASESGHRSSESVYERPRKYGRNSCTTKRHKTNHRLTEHDSGGGIFRTVMIGVAIASAIGALAFFAYRMKRTQCDANPNPNPNPNPPAVVGNVFAQALGLDGNGDANNTLLSAMAKTYAKQTAPKFSPPPQPLLPSRSHPIPASVPFPMPVPVPVSVPENTTPVPVQTSAPQVDVPALSTST